MRYWLISGLASLAAFAAVALLGSLAAWLGAPWAERGPDAASRSRRFLALRLAPSLAGLALGGGLVLPAFLAFEPRGTNEVPGAALLVLAWMGALAIAAGLRRAVGDFRATRRLRRLWDRRGRALSLPGSPAPACAIRHPFPVVSVVGVLRPRLYVAEQVLERLSPSELAAVVAHEAGHLASRDNLKRLALRLAPALPWPGPSRRLAAAWLEAAEEAADARASNALELASALVKTARLVPPGAHLGLPVAAFHRNDSVTRRVRLLTSAPASASAEGRRIWPYALAAAVGIALSWATPLLAVVHRLVEPLVHLF
jgi:hypothetical protein